MGKYNEILSGRFNKALTKVFGMKGGAPAAQLAGDVQAAFQFFSGAESRVHESWYRYGLAFNVPAVAAVNGTFRLRNPANSGVVAVIERALASGVLADQPQLQLGSTAVDLAAIAIPTNRLDPRGQSSTVLSPSRSIAAPGGLTVTLQQGAFPVNGFFDFIASDIGELTLLPGDAYQIQSNVLNQAIVISWMWRERVMEDSERQ